MPEQAPITYTALIEFNDYYTQLSPEKIAAIPEPVLQEIETLLNLSSDKNKNSNATANLKTCTAIRRQTLEEAVNQHQAALSQIGVDEAKKAHLLEEARVLFERCKSRIGEGGCEGRDLLGITCALLNGLEMKVTITSHRDLDDFMTFNPDEIKMICREKNLGSSIAGQFPDIEALVMFSVNAPLDRLDALLPFISNSLASRLIKTPKDFSSWLMTLSDERCSVVCSALKDRLPEIIRSIVDLGSTLQYLTPEQCTAVYIALKSKLPEIIKTIDDFRNTLEYLTPEQCTAVVDAMKDRLPEIIKKPHKNLPVFRKDLRKHFPEIGTQFDRSYFDSLLAQLDEKAKQLKEGGREQAAASVLSETLRNARDNYCNEAMTDSSYHTFKAACTDALASAAREIRDTSWSRLFKTILITVLFWPAPLASAIKSTCETGRFRHRFFDSPTLKTRDEISTVVKAIAPENRG